MVGGGEVETQLLGWLLAPGRAAGRAAPDRRTDRKVCSFRPQAGASEGAALLTLILGSSLHT